MDETEVLTSGARSVVISAHAANNDTLLAWLMVENLPH